MAKNSTPRLSKKTREGWDRYRVFCTEFGMLMVNFLQVEDAMQRALEYHSGVNDAVRRAVFSGLRIHDAISLMRRLADVGQIKPKEWKSLKRLLDQLAILNDARNALVHHGAEGIWEGSGWVTTEFRALLPDRVREFPISAETVRQMASDVGTIFLLISYWHCGPNHRPRTKHVRGFLAEYAAEPWLYKPPPPTPHRPSPGGKFAARPHQRRSIRELPSRP